MSELLRMRPVAHPGLRLIGLWFWPVDAEAALVLESKLWATLYARQYVERYRPSDN